MSYPKYTEMIEQVDAVGSERASRFGDTVEMVAGSIAFGPGEVVRRPNLNTRLAWMEAVQTIAGTFDADSIAAAAPNAPHFFTADIAYGPRLAAQLEKAVDKLAKNSLDRQVVLHIGRESDMEGDFPPCAQTLQFLARDGQLVAMLYWRSWDMLVGLPYDVWNFQVLTSAVALALGLEPGPLACFVGSAHYYVKNTGLIPLDDQRRKVGVDLSLEGTPEMKWRTLVFWAQQQACMDNWAPNEKGELFRPRNTFATPWAAYYA